MMHALVRAARDVGELVEAHAEMGERNRELCQPVLDALRAEGLMRMCVPAVYGGPEADPLTASEAIEAVASADGAAGWCVMIASTTSSMSLFMEPEWAQKIFADPNVVTGGVFAPNGTAQMVDGGWKVSGRWNWGSGTRHCEWITGGVTVDDPVTGERQTRMMWFEADDVTIHDTWYTSGLRGTGSNEFSVDGVFVPSGRDLQPLAASRFVDCPLAMFPNFTLLAIGVASVSLGIARHALDEFTELAQGKRPQFSSRTLSQSGSVQAELAKAEGSLRAARAFLHDEVGTAWDTVVRGDRVDVDARARMRLAGVVAAEAATRAVDVAYTMGGGTSVFETSPLQRCLRDVHVTTQHIMVAPRLHETLGKMFFGLPVDSAMF